MTISNSSGRFEESMMNNLTQNSPSSSSSSSSFSNNNNNSDAAVDFECNICLDLAQDPIVTLCGHLFCWPCLYKWLHLHSRSHECPVCKALIEEDKLVPLYGRGKNSTNPRVKSIPDVDIPNRPTGQRPETAPDVNSNNNHNFGQNGFGFMGGFGGFPAPTAAGATRFGSLTLSAAFGGLIPALFNLHVHGFSDAAVYGANPNGFSFGGHSAANWFYGGHAHGVPQQRPHQGNQDYYLKMLFLFVGVCIILALIGL